MKFRTAAFSLLLALVVSTGNLASAQQPPPGITAKRLPAPQPGKPAKPSFDEDTVLVKFRKGASEAARAETRAAHRTRSRGRAGATGWELLDTQGRAPRETARELERDPDVEDAELNYLRRASVTPNDPAFVFGDQEYLKRIRMPAAWDRTKGTTKQMIAILDTGVDLDHPDLVNRVRPGYDFVNEDSVAADDNGHGTIVAGVAAGMTNNGRGIAASAWNAAIQPVKVLDHEGFGTDADIAQGITWAADRGAKVLNLSLGGPGSSPVLEAAINYAIRKDKVVVAAAGNEATSVPHFPAAYGPVLAVSATSDASNFAWWSNYGWWIDVAAPGIDIVGPFAGPGEPYVIASGTSFAAPLVSGVAFLTRIRFPHFNQLNTVTRIRNTSRDHGPRGVDPFYGKGRVDGGAALGAGVVSPAPQPPQDALEPNPTADRAVALSGSRSATISPEGDHDWYFVDVPAPGSVTFTVTPPPFHPSGVRAFELDPVLEVYGPDLQSLGIGDETFVGDPEIITVPAPEPGRYYLEVSNYAGSRSPGAYTVTATLGGEAPPAEPGPMLWIRDHSPPDFALGQPQTTNATVEFARAVDASTINGSTVALLHGKTLSAVPASVAFDAAVNTVTIDPSVTLARNTPYIVVVAGVRDTSGEALGLYTFRFTTTG